MIRKDPFDKSINYEWNQLIKNCLIQQVQKKGIVNKNLYEYKKAILCYKNAIKINPKHADAYNNIGIIYVAFAKSPFKTSNAR